MSEAKFEQNYNAVFAKCVKRAKNSGVNVLKPTDVIVFLGREIEDYRRKLDYAESRIQAPCEEQMRISQLEQELIKERKVLDKTSTLEAIQENGITEIIKALSDNGFKTITINCYKE